MSNGDVVLNRDGKLLRPKRLESKLFRLRAGTGEDRSVLDCITSLQNGADMIWIETEKPHIGRGGVRSREIARLRPASYSTSLTLTVQEINLS